MKIRVKQSFRDHMAATGLTSRALAGVLGVPLDFFLRATTGRCAPSASYLAGAVLSGLANNLAEVAEVEPERRPRFIHYPRPTT